MGLLGRRSVRAIRSLAERTGHDLVARNVYSPIPPILPEGDPEWDSRSELPGVDWDLDAQLEFARSRLAPYLPELREGDDLQRLVEAHNDWFRPVDSEVLYAMVRELRPSRVLEVGAGRSTELIAAARAANAADGRKSSHVAVDVQRNSELESRLDGRVEFEWGDAAKLAPERFLELEAGDLLFVDSAHVVRRGGEVNLIVLEVLPRLRPGVAVHFHDVFLPYDYPRTFAARGTYLSEQYLLQAFLAGNRDWAVLFAAHALARERTAELRELFPRLHLRPTAPCSLWLTRHG